MSNSFPNIFGWVDGLLRFAIGFLVGIALGYTAQLAEVSSWWFAGGTFAVIAIFFFVMFKVAWAMDQGVGRLFDWAGGVKYPGGIKPAKNPAPEPKPHWFVRFGWMPALVLGAVAVYVLPEGVLAWLL